MLQVSKLIMAVLQVSKLIMAAFRCKDWRWPTRDDSVQDWNLWKIKAGIYCLITLFSGILYKAFLCTYHVHTGLGNAASEQQGLHALFSSEKKTRRLKLNMRLQRFIIEHSTKTYFLPCTWPNGMFFDIVEKCTQFFCSPAHNFARLASSYRLLPLAGALHVLGEYDKLLQKIYWHHLFVHYIKYLLWDINKKLWSWRPSTTYVHLMYCDYQKNVYGRLCLW